MTYELYEGLAAAAANVYVSIDPPLVRPYATARRLLGIPPPRDPLPQHGVIVNPVRPSTSAAVKPYESESKVSIEILVSD